MCGIVGLFSKSPAIADRLGEHLADMLVQLSDRGPDSAGVAVYRDPAPPGAAKLTLFSADPAEDWAASPARCRRLRRRRRAPGAGAATRPSWSRPTPRRRRPGCARSGPTCAS